MSRPSAPSSQPQEELAIDVKEACLAPLTFASHRYEIVVANVRPS